MAINDPDPGENAGHGSTRRRFRIHELVGFAVGLLAFIGIGRLVKGYSDTNEMRSHVNQMDHQPTHVGNPEVKHERRDINIRGIVIAGIVLIVVVGLAQLVLWGMFNYLAARQARADVPLSPVVDTEQIPPAPRLQANPAADWREMVARENELLNKYEWIDENAGIVRIPIARAMELLAERRLPVREGGALPESDQIPGLERGYELESEGGQELEITPEPLFEATPTPEQ
jgi:hypothetical protein